MKIEFICVLTSILLSFGNCDNELLAVNCRDKILRQYINDTWKIRNYSIPCPLTDRALLNICIVAFNKVLFNSIIHVRSRLNSSLCENAICDKLDINITIYKCISSDKNSKALEVPSNCIFRHTLTNKNCLSEENWSNSAKIMCSTDEDYKNYVLLRMNGIFKCVDRMNKVQTYKAMQFVCCPKLNNYDNYINHLQLNNGSIKLEKLLFEAAKKSLRESFKISQKVIEDRYIEEEKSINALTKYPKIAFTMEKKIQEKFKKKFMSEMYKELDLLNELEIMHENNMQKLFEENRKNAMSRLEYTLQEGIPQADRIADALKLELNSILSEAEDITHFYEMLNNEDVGNLKRNKDLIKGNFRTLITQSWDEAIKFLDTVPNIKNEVLEKISSYNIRKNNIIERFKYLTTNNRSKNSMENQARNHINNIISLHEIGQFINKPGSILPQNFPNQNEKTNDTRIILICMLCLSLIMLMSISLFMYRFHGKINSYLSNTFKKIHPPTKSLFVQIDNYPFKNRYNYGNGIYQPYFKSEESIIGNPTSVYNQHFTAVNDSSNEVLKKSVESEFSESTISNINGLENPICRLLDEK